MRRRLNKMKILQLATVFFLGFLVLKYYQLNNELNSVEDNKEVIFIDEQNQPEIILHDSDFLRLNYSNQTKNVKLFDLRRKLEPADVYDSIKCRKLTSKVKTTLCVHETKDDVHVSGQIWNKGIWEKRILEYFVDFLKKNKDHLVIDVGSHVGLYSLTAAKLGHYVIAVEPFEPNNLRLHKAALIERLENRITLIQNAVTNRPNEIKLLQKNRDNIGGQTLISDNINQTYAKNNSNAYLVETILLDDLINYIPRVYKKAILKIDIEGFEPIAFEKAQNLFNAINISMVFMEWGSISSDRIQQLLYDQTINMMNFFKQNNYEPYDQNYNLELRKWTYDWPWDVIWKKK